MEDNYYKNLRHLQNYEEEITIESQVYIQVCRQDERFRYIQDIEQFRDIVDYLINVTNYVPPALMVFYDFFSGKRIEKLAEVKNV